MPSAAAFFSFMFLTTFTPGPNNIMAMTNAARLGLRGSLRFCLGVFAGFIVVMTACAALCTALFASMPTIEPVMRCAGAAYILYLAAAVYKSGDAPEKRTSGLRPESMANGLLMQCVNVKVILYGLTALSTFVLPYYSDAAALGAFIILLSAVGFAGTVCWAAFGSAFRKLFTERRRLLNALMATALVCCAVSIVL